MSHDTESTRAARRNRIGVHAQVWVGGWSREAATYAVTESAAAGFDLIEIPAGDVPHFDVAHTAKLLADTGIGAVLSLALPADGDIASEDTARVARGEQLLTAAVDLAAELGLDYVGGVTYSKMGLSAHPASPRARANSQAVLGRVAARAAASNVSIGLEYVNRYESNLLNTAADTVAFIREIGADNLRVHIDTFHANTEERSQAAAVRDSGDLLAYVHAGENHRGRLGSGSIDWSSFFASLATSGFSGPITFESFSDAVLDDTISHPLGLWRTPWRDARATARQAREFIAAQLDAAAPSS
ncbi:sugar phosphate isomerase/epimerase [Frondihabitans cladoniiphilus]|uniref:Sugar phosphate isomerase/epimerase n=2 Tax=Frondihabitans cladoniiphilus TaxID=715785 RepID=A0ABP8W048_9MICO